MNSKPIGIFDSGVGGLTVMSEVAKLLPGEDIIYFGDTARVPYGSKSKEAISRFAQEICEFLLNSNVKLIIVACNTASAFALEKLQKLPVPVLGVIAPGAMAALGHTKNLRVGVIGTHGTVKSKSYIKAIKKLNPRVNVFSNACPLFVPLVEEGWLAKPVTYEIAREYIAPLKAKKIDVLVLGCTHYPLLKKVIGKVTGKNVRLIDSASATAVCAKDILIKKNMLSAKKRGSYKFFVSDSPEKFKSVGEKFLGRKIQPVVKINFD